MRPRLLALAFALPAATASAAPAIHVPRGEPQLFIDDRLIAEGRGVERTLRQPVKDDDGRKPVIAIPRMLLGHLTTLEAYSSIVYDTRLGRWVMFAQAYMPQMPKDDPEAWRRTHFLRFTSADAIHWESDSPDGMERVFPRTRQDLNGPDGKPYAMRADSSNFWYDEKDREWPYQGWIWLYKEGVRYVRSHDGHSFAIGPLVLPYQAKAIVQRGFTLLGPDDVTRFAPDPENGRFLAILKFMKDRRDMLVGNQLRSRAYLFIDRLDKPVDLSPLDHVHLVPAMAQQDGDMPHDEYYDSTAWRYGSGWIGTLRIWHSLGSYSYSPSGSAYLKLMTSDDGIHWSRVRYPNDAGIPEVFLANGAPEGGDGGRNDAGYMSNFSQGPLRVGDELVYYYGASSYGKNAAGGLRMTGGGIFRARLRLDGFVSVDFGQITTPALAFDGETLTVNHAGAVSVEALDPGGVSLARVRLEGDHVRDAVVFNGRTLRQLAAADGTVRLQFFVEDGSRLYAFRIE